MEWTFEMPGHFSGARYTPSFEENFTPVKGDARHFVGKRYGDELEGLFLDQLLRPHPQRVGMGLRKQHRVRPRRAVCASSGCQAPFWAEKSGTMKSMI
jgi:hypothetical protein